MNIYDISKQSGVSIATVSRCINNSGYVSEKTRAKIMKVIEENDYAPSAFAKGMATNTMNCVGILCTDSRDLYQADCIYHLEKNLHKHGYAGILGCTGHELKEKKEEVRLLLSRSLDALIFIGSQYTEAEDKDNGYIRDAAKRIPIIMLNGDIRGDNIFTIACDDKAASKALTSLCLDNGSKKPVFLNRRLNYSGRQKLEGFKDACKDHNIEDYSHYTVKDDLEEIINCIEDLHLAGKGTDCYICADDEIALGALKYVQAHNQKIPEDVQITGFNNSVLAQASTPEITTYDNQVSYMCQSAIFTLTGVLENRDFPSKTTYEGKIVVKGTTRNSK